MYDLTIFDSILKESDPCEADKMLSTFINELVNKGEPIEKVIEWVRNQIELSQRD